jgi:hypothetical protein
VSIFFSVNTAAIETDIVLYPIFPKSFKVQQNSGKAANIRLGWKWLTMTNSLAYYGMELITAVKSYYSRCLWQKYFQKTLKNTIFVFKMELHSQNSLLALHTNIRLGWTD